MGSWDFRSKGMLVGAGLFHDETILGLSRSTKSSDLPVTPSTSQWTFVHSPPVLIL